MNAGPPEEITEAEAERREAQERVGTPFTYLYDDPTDERHEILAELAVDHWDDAKWHGILSKDGLTLAGNQAGNDRALRIDMDHGKFSVFTTHDLGGGNAAGGSGVQSGSAPTASATWRGLMIGAAKNDGQDLLLGDAAVSFDFAANTVDASFTGIVNMDLMAAHSVPDVMFPDVPVTANGQWRRGGSGDPKAIWGGFAGPDHIQAGGRFWTPDMTGAFGAQRQ